MERRERTIDLSELIQIFKTNLLIIICAGFVGGLALGTVTCFLIPPKYQSNTKSLVINQQDSNTLTYSDFQSSTQFIEDYKEVVQSRSVLQSVINNLQLTESLNELEDMMDVSIVNDTHHLKITVTADTPEKAQLIAEEITETASVMFGEVMKINAVNVIDHANLPERQSSPNLKINILLGVVTGLILCMLVVFTKKLLDDRIYTAEDFTSQFDYPILGSIPYNRKFNKSRNKKRGKQRR